MITGDCYAIERFDIIGCDLIESAYGGFALFWGLDEHLILKVDRVVARQHGKRDGR